MSNRLQLYAVGAASVAVLISLIAVSLVATRGAKGAESAAVTFEATVAATDIVKLKRDAVEASGAGMRVREERLATSLGLQPGDIVTMVGGHALKRENDVYEAILAASMFEVTLLDIDIVRDGNPLLIRWKIDGDLKSARRINDTSRPPSTYTPSPTPAPDPLDPWSSSYGGSLTARDPLLDTITKVDDNHYEVPRSTIDRALANPMDFAKGARAVPAMKYGVPAGIKLYAIRPNSLYGAIGINNGDTIKTINGFDLSSVDKALEVYTKIKDATSLEIEIERRGSAVTLQIDIK